MKIKLVICSILLLVVFCQYSCTTTKEKTIDEILYDLSFNLITDTTGSGDTAKLFIPNALTPNGDNANDNFLAFGSGFSSMNLKVFDVKGNQVWQTNSFANKFSPSYLNGINAQFIYTFQGTTLMQKKIGKSGIINALFCLPNGNTLTNYQFVDQFNVLNYTQPLVTTEIIKSCP
jgi:hypothetical protein